MLQEILKRIITIAGMASEGWPARHWWALDGLFSDSGDSLTHGQFAKFPLVGRYHASPMLQSSMAFCVGFLANPHFDAIPFSLEPISAAAGRKTPYKVSSESIVTQSLGTSTRTLIL